jgi:hypothetical protein
MWPFTVDTLLHGSTGDEAYAKRFGEFLRTEFDAAYEGVVVRVGGSQEIATHSFRVGSKQVVLEIETYIGVTLVASRSLTARILRAARAAGIGYLNDDQTSDEIDAFAHLKPEVFQQALDECDALLAKYPALEVVLSIKDQVSFLADVHAGRRFDHSRFKDLVLGVQLAREVAHLLSPGIRDVFHEIAAFGYHLQHRAIAHPRE